MDDVGAYYAPPAPPGIHSSLYPQYQHSPPPLPPPHQPSLVLPLPSLHSPPPSASAFSRPSHSLYDDVRTLFVAGLPADVNPREIYNLFRDFPGYESSNLRPNSKNTQPFAFAVFSNQQSAVAAMHALNGMVFDLQKGSTLYIDLAKSNSRSKRQRTDDEGSYSEKKFKASPVYTRGNYDMAGVGSFHSPGMGNSAYNTIGYPSSQSHLRIDGRLIGEADTPKSNYISHAKKPNPPCPTIFVANLGPNCTENELLQVFSRCRGFLKLKIQSSYGSHVGFVDFQDTGSSTEALHLLQGTVLYSTPSGEGMRLEYAKSRMGMRRKPK